MTFKIFRIKGSTEFVFNFMLQDANQARPMTAVRAAGYSSAGGRGIFLDLYLTNSLTES